MRPTLRGTISGGSDWQKNLGQENDEELRGEFLEHGGTLGIDDESPSARTSPGHYVGAGCDLRQIGL